MEKYLLCCDWGTSSFRLRLFHQQEKKVVEELVSEKGIASMHNEWLERSGQEKAITKNELFRHYLQKQMGALKAKRSENIDHVPLLISGMASSSIGMEDIAYAKVPFALDGSDTMIKSYDEERNFPHKIYLISGVRTDNDVMRGEETQLIGLLELLEKTGSKPNEGIFIFPGTHSKHILIHGGKLASFQTFMTGELFNIIRNYSILKASVQLDEGGSITEKDADAFKQGLQESEKSGILNRLFTVRTNQLFGKLDKHQNALYLSGLLIGEELNYLQKKDMQLLLSSGSNLFGFYSLAFQEMGLSGRTTIVPFDLADKAAAFGQYLIFQKFLSTSN